MKIKEGATIAGLDIRMRPVLLRANAVWNRLGQELVVTSGLDGTHSAGSLHYYGRAVDFRTHYFADKGAEAARLLGDGLPDDYQVVLENTHIHVEYDPG